MNAALCESYNVLHYVIYGYMLLMLVYAVLSWVPDLRGSWSRYVERLVEPVLTPVRRIIPPAAGIDWSFLVVIILLQLLAGIVGRASFSVCYSLY